ncbi:hypothetical protein PG988_016150 [Apiospora saccharicola]
MLELAEAGSLFDLYKRNEPPTSREDIYKFWMGLVGLAEGLEALHNSTHGTGVTIIHQDLKPSNVLVCEDNAGPQPTYHFKIGDLGASTVNSGTKPERALGPDTGAGKTYAPPELRLGLTIDYEVGAYVDIWALGCILLEAAIWVSFGEPDRQRFRDRRICEIARLSDDPQALDSDAFHNGSKALMCVEDVHRWILSDGRKCDNFTPDIVRYVLDHCLNNNRKGRPSSENVAWKLNEILHLNSMVPKRMPSSPSSGMSREQQQHVNGYSKYAQSPDAIESPHAPQSPPAGPLFPFLNPGGSPTPRELVASPDILPPTIIPVRTPPQQPPRSTTAPQHPSNGNQSLHQLKSVSVPAPPTPSPARPPPVPPIGSSDSATSINSLQPANSLREVTYEVVLDWMEGKKNKLRTELPGWKQAQNNLGNRDYMIVVDNSKTMQKYRPEVSEFAKAMSYLIKKLDRDGFEVVLTSAPTVPTLCKSATDVKDILDKSFLDGHSADCDMEYTLDKVLTDVRTKLQKPTTEGSTSTLARRFSLWSKAPAVTAVSIFVLTTGVWDGSPEGTCGVENPIEVLVKWMREHGVGRTEAAIQFVRFGTSERGIRRLKALDDDLPTRESCKDL